MIHNTINFLSLTLNDYLAQKLPINMTGNSGGSGAAPKKVDFPIIDTDPPKLNTEVVNLLLFNIEEDRILRSANPYDQLDTNGIVNKVSPPLRLELSILFAAKFADYPTALKHLSWTTQFFQSNPLFTSNQFPSLPDNIDKLFVDFFSMGHTLKNEVWSSLKIAYLPSVAYKVKMLVYQEDIPSMGANIEEMDIQINQI